MPALSAKLAFNPIPWFLTPDGWHPERAPPYPEMLTVIARTGYAGVHAEVQPGMTAASYKAVLQEHGLQPAPGYFHIGFSDPAAWPVVVETAKKVAAEHAQLGLDRIFLAELFAFEGVRLKKPAVGADFDQPRLNRIIDGIGRTAEAMAAEGVLPCLHSHVNTWIETVDEFEAVLKAIPDTVLKVGPDTGHIAWAGGDPVAFFKRHAPRIGAVHIKDMRKTIATDGQRDGLDYFAHGSAGLWTEPGRGDVDMAGIMDALAGFSGWAIVEVDMKDQPTVEDTARVSREWLRPWFPG